MEHSKTISIGSRNEPVRVYFHLLRSVYGACIRSLAAVLSADAGVFRLLSAVKSYILCSRLEREPFESMDTESQWESIRMGLIETRSMILDLQRQHRDRMAICNRIPNQNPTGEHEEMEYSSGEGEAEQLPQVAAPPPPPPPPPPPSSGEESFCWPWTAIVVNIVNEPESGKDVENTEYWMKRFSKYKPEVVEILWDDDQKQKAQAFVRFNTDWIGCMNATEFEKAFEADHHGKKEWVAAENPSSSSIYAWLARSNDFESQGPIGDFLRTKRELKTVSDLAYEAAKTRYKAMAELAAEIDTRNEKLEDLQIKCNQQNMALRRMLEEEKDRKLSFCFTM